MLMWDDGYAELLELLVLCGGGVKSEPTNRVDLAGESLVSEEQLRNQEAGLAINSRDADVS